VIFNEVAELNTSLEFLNEPASIEIVAVPENPVLGVNVAVYVVPEPVKPEIVPPAEAMSSGPKSVLAWSNVKVMVAVLDPPNVVADEVIVATGFRLSNV
jgi:hypothetical protein